MVGRRRFVPAAMLGLAVLGLVALGLAVLWAFGKGEQTADWRGWERESALGLSFAMPPGRIANVFGTRIDLDKPAAVRTTNYIALYPDGPPPAARLGDGPVLREGATPAPFTIRENHGGSGGAAYTLYTTKDLDGRSIALLAVIQAEGLFTPSFAEAWAVWESLRQAD